MTGRACARGSGAKFWPLTQSKVGGTENEFRQHQSVSQLDLVHQNGLVPYSSHGNGVCRPQKLHVQLVSCPDDSLALRLLLCRLGQPGGRNHRWGKLGFTDRRDRQYLPSERLVSIERYAL